MSSKQRLSATVDADLLARGHEVVAAGRAESLSAWVNEALRAQVERDRRLAAMDAFLAAFESEHGEISDAEIASAARAARARAVVVRGRGPAADAHGTVSVPPAGR
jgi:hypothetical protein